jgi:hypothetical protein
MEAHRARHHCKSDQRAERVQAHEAWQETDKQKRRGGKFS